MDNRLIKIFSIIMVAVVLTTAGCGGSSKKKKTAKGAAEGIITGKVDYFTGFNMFPAETPASKVKADKLLARLYRVQPDGSGLAPVSEVQSVPADGGSFKLDKAPAGELNMILRIENEKSEPVMSAIVPPPTAAGTSLVVSPETTLEAALLAGFLKDGYKTPGDLRPEELDASFIKDFVLSDLYYNGKIETDEAKLIASMLPVIKHAYGRFVEGFAGNGATPGSATAIAMARDLSGAEMALNVATEKGEKVPENLKNDFLNTLKKKAEENGIVNEMMTPEAAWLSARRLAFSMAVKCITVGNTVPGCPNPTEGGADLSLYASLLDTEITETIETENLSARLEYLFEGAATGSQKMAPVDAVQKMAALPGAMVEAFRNEGLRLGKNLENEKSREQAIVLLGNLRDSFSISAMGMEKETISQMMSSLSAAAQPLVGTLANPAAPASQLGKSHRQFMNGLDIPLGMIMSAARSRYTKFEESDLKKLSLAMLRVVLLTSLPEIPAYLLDGKDMDGDGYSDNTERMMGTEASDGGSVPGVVLAAMPASMLPTQMADSDADGWPDAVEKLATTSPDDRTSTPRPGWMITCDETQSWCHSPLPEEEPQAEKFEISGIVRFNKQEVSGLKVGIYSSPAFEGKIPVSASENTTDERGGYSITVKKAGKYYVAAFRDMDGSESPGRGEAVGYHGSPYPAFIEIEEGSIKTNADIEMIGIAGASRCESGKLYNPATGECVTECSAGLKKDELTLECRCADGALFSETSGKCVAECPAGTLSDPLRGGCFCPAGAKSDVETGTCVCENAGMKFSETKTACMCESGYMMKKEMRCVPECPAFLVADDESGECTCSPGMSLDGSGLKCVCDEGFIDPSGKTCIKKCQPSYVKAADGLRCECPANEMYSSEKSECVCVPGMEKSAQGICAAPTIPKPAPADPNMREDRRPPVSGVATGTVEMMAPGSATATVETEIMINTVPNKATGTTHTIEDIMNNMPVAPAAGTETPRGTPIENVPPPEDENE